MNSQINQLSSARGLHVVFGTGQAGLPLAELLASQGKRVRIVSRSGKATVSAGIEVCAADATDPAAIADLCQGAAVAYHCLGVPYPQQCEILPKLQQALIAGVGAAGAILVALNDLYVYGETHGQVITEQTPHAATTRKGSVRRQITRDYLQAHQDGKIRVAMGRAADFFGPRALNSSLGGFAFPPALAGKPAQVLGNINLPHSYSYIKDVARGLATLGEREEALGREWLLPVAPAVTTREMVRLIEKAVGHPVRILAIPKVAIQAMGVFNPMMREAVEMFYQYTEPQIVSSAQFEDAFGWRATPLDQAIGETVAWFGQQAQVGAPAK